MVPVDAVTALETGLLAAVEVAALAFLIVVGISAFRYMRSAVGGDSPYAGYTVMDDVSDRASGYQNERTTFDGDGNASLSDSTRDYSDASKDVIRQQKYF